MSLSLRPSDILRGRVGLVLGIPSVTVARTIMSHPRTGVIGYIREFSLALFLFSLSLYATSLFSSEYQVLSFYRSIMTLLIT